MNDLKKRLLEMVKEDLEKIEGSLAWHLTTSFDLVSKVASHLLFSGGKRLRPLLLILSARICGYAGKLDLDFATAFEYLHTATLLHDDIVDGATVRRGKPVAHALWNSATAVLVGDFLFARASSIAAQTRQIEAIEILANVTEEMSQGELFQLAKKGNLDITEAEYLDVIRRKTAVLFQGACRIGAGLAHADEEQKHALATYGFNLGVSFQMADDLLDYTQKDIKTLGKKAGADLREGKVTLPVIDTLKKADPKDRNLIKGMIQNKDFSIDEFEALIALMEKYGGLTYARKAALKYVDQAKNALLIFPESQTRGILLGFADYALERDS
jgi:octaprenyl-diphosphate synthase